jgi:hypothetical protein
VKTLDFDSAHTLVREALATYYFCYNVKKILCSLRVPLSSLFYPYGLGFVAHYVAKRDYGGNARLVAEDIMEELTGEDTSAIWPWLLEPLTPYTLVQNWSGGQKSADHWFHAECVRREISDAPTRWSRSAHRFVVRPAARRAVRTLLLCLKAKKYSIPGEVLDAIIRVFAESRRADPRIPRL